MPACRKVGDVGKHPCHRKPDVGALLLAEVVPVREVHVPHDCASGHRVEAKTLGGKAGTRRHDNALAHHAGIAQGPLQGLLAAKRPADDSKKMVDPKTVKKHLLHHHPVANSHHRKGEAVGLASGRIYRRGTCGPVATAKDIRADNVKTVGVYRLARTYHRIPPPGMGKAPFPLRMVLCSGIPSGNMGIS